MRPGLVWPRVTCRKTSRRGSPAEGPAAEDYGLRVRVVAVDADAGASHALGPTDPSVPAAVRIALTVAPGRAVREWLTWVTSDQDDCDVLLKIDGRSGMLVPATGGIAGAIDRPRPPRDLPDSLRGGWGPVDLSTPDATTQLRGLLRRVVRARNLMRLAAELERDQQPLRVRLELGKVDLDENLTVREFEAVPTEGGLHPLPPARDYLRVPDHE